MERSGPQIAAFWRTQGDMPSGGQNKGSALWPKQGEEKEDFYSNAKRQGTHFEPQLKLSAADVKDTAKVATHERRVAVVAGVCEQAELWHLTETASKSCRQGRKEEGRHLGVGPRQLERSCWHWRRTLLRTATWAAGRPRQLVTCRLPGGRN